MANTGGWNIRTLQKPLTTVLLCLSVLVTVGAAPPRSGISFHSEKISISIAEKQIEIDAEYHFTGPVDGATTARLYYPFPVDSLHPFPEDISVSSRGNDIKFRASEEGIYFDVSVDTSGTGRVDVRYLQSCFVPSGCYILTSTAAWGKPLIRAEFEISIPTDIVMLSCSYEPDTVLTDNDSSIYLITRENFLPEEDLCIEWLRKK